MNSAVREVVIVGGGSAGWLTAALIAAEFRDGLRVTVLESPEVAPIGVGEGTWPTMRDTLRRIGVSESALVRECDAAFKQGSKFVGWVDGRPDDHYHHPFVLPQGYTEANLVAEWLRRHAQVPFADLVSFQPHLCAAGKAPKQAQTPEFAAVANYAYHLDAGKFGVFLRRHCVEKLGVQHVSDHMLAVNSHENGDIASLQTRQHGALAGDLFIDCTGMRSLAQVLFNDSALAVPVPYTQPDEPVASQTISTAQSSGWIWDIGLPSRRGMGYVYSSAHISDDAAAQELLRHIAASGAASNDLVPRKLSFQPGYREKFWHRNCVAIGLSSGFIEPLEASALVLVELSAALLCDEMPTTRARMDLVAARFNDAFSYRWGRVIDFLKLHYVLTRRTDTAYWRDHCDPASIPERLAEQLQLWRQQAPSRHDLFRVDELFPSASYHYVLYGMGFRPDPDLKPRCSDHREVADRAFREAASLTRRMLAALPGHRELLDQIKLHGLPTT
jgi:tryptophan 7-halogenase